VANSLNNLGLVLSVRRDYAGARRMIEESLAISRELGDRWAAANSLSSLAETALDHGDLAAARSYLRESLKINLRLGDRTAIAFALETGARLAGRAGEHAGAVRLAAAAQALREAIGVPLSPAEQERLDEALAASRRQLSSAEQAACESAGRSQPPEETFQEIIGNLALPAAEDWPA
jgi:tetratricopeptide (TPR) repeat protein